MVSTSAGETATETVGAEDSPDDGGDGSCSGTRMPCSSATAFNFEGLKRLCLWNFSPDEVQETAKFLKWQ
ncbi:UNVERIFIED_CONTAM: hypothetical protein Sradi_0793100 [Sesamum radiatum]|uniref:Uncharacterized protein n=1 Tax=Sesamum radiatum TaxID=300843 RepID=A0AAW2VTL8_SESRA